MTKRRKPTKPYPGFPLYAHSSGQWAKTIRKRTVYFGPWDDPSSALDKFHHERDYLYTGKPLPPEIDGLTLDELVNRFLVTKRAAMDADEITRLHFLDYERDSKELLKCLGRSRPVETLQPEDFTRLRVTLGKGRNATTLTNIIIRIRSIFNWGYRFVRGKCFQNRDDPQT